MPYPSIFNDVLGPVMRGPSSSHCAASLRIGRLCRDLLEGDVRRVLVEYDPNGSLATTHKGQGSDMGLFGGLLGWEAHDDRLPNYQRGVEEAGLNITIEIVDYGAAHPNTYKLTLANETETHTVTAISTGGGMIEVIEVDGATVSMIGDYYETLVYVTDPESVAAWLRDHTTFDEISVHKGRRSFVEVKGQAFLPPAQRTALEALDAVVSIRELAPVLPVLSRQGMTVPFITCDEMLAWNTEHDFALWELAVQYESARGGLSHAEVLDKMRALVDIMQGAIDTGLAGTSYPDRILGNQSAGFRDQMAQQTLVSGGVLNQMILSVTAIMEVKSSMGVIVAAPTAGACGALPGGCLGATLAMDLDREAAVRAMLAAGMIGVFIANGATFAAEVGGCQAECGAGAGMLASALVTLAGGTLDQALSASSFALQNSFGMICDPVANRVEAPCLGKNVMAASNALSCANMALAGYNHLIPLDEVITAMDAVGKSLPMELRCTGYGGLAATPTARAIEARLAASEHNDFEDGMALNVLRFKSC